MTGGARSRAEGTHPNASLEALWFAVTLTEDPVALQERRPTGFVPASSRGESTPGYAPVAQ